MATFGTNYGLQTADKAVTGCTKVALRFYGPLPVKQMIDTLVFFSQKLTLKIPQAQKSNALRSGDFGGHCAVEMKRGTSFLSHSWLTC